MMNSKAFFLIGLSKVYSSEEYMNAWDNFKRYLEDNNMILIVEMEW